MIIKTYNKDPEKVSDLKNSLLQLSGRDYKLNKQHIQNKQEKNNVTELINKTPIINKDKNFQNSFQELKTLVSVKKKRKITDLEVNFFKKRIKTLKLEGQRVQNSI